MYLYEVYVTPTPFINIQMSNESTFVEIEDKEPLEGTIDDYVGHIASALRGLTFSDKTIYNGFKQWCEEFELRKLR